MLLKIKRRSITVRNSLVFAILSLLFLHIVTSLGKGASAFNIEELYFFLNQYRWLLFFYLILLYTIYNVKKISCFLFPFGIILISGFAFRYFLMDFNKVILLLDFIYLICAHYFVLLWFSELNDPIYNPGFNFLDIDKSPNKRVKCLFLLTGGEQIEGELRNWGEQSCFAGLSSQHKWSEIKKIKFVEIKYKNLIVKESVSIYTRYDDGIGFKIKTNENNMSKKWSIFYKLTRDKKLIYDWYNFKTSIGK